MDNVPPTETQPEQKNNTAAIIWILVAAIVLILAIFAKETGFGSRIPSPFSGSSSSVAYGDAYARPKALYKPDLQLLGWRTVRGEYTSKIVGKVKNNTGKKYRYVQIEFNLLNKKGEVVGSTLDNMTNLGASKVWSFNAPILHDDADTVEVQGITGR
jgi:hypothetical protein